eukprot:5609753-Amphidinium_carterae.1
MRIPISKVVIGCTTEDKVKQKHEDVVFAAESTRLEIIKAVMREGRAALAPVEVENNSQPTSYKLATLHAESECQVLYLAGTDLYRRAFFDQTILVTRSSKELHLKEFFDHSVMAGLCIQRDSLDVSSTSVRRALAAGQVPASYCPESRLLISKALQTMQVAAPSPPVQSAQASGASTTLPSNRPFPFGPFGPVFAKVLCFPPPELTKLIQTTAHYAVKSLQPEKFSKRVLMDSLDKTFVKEGDIYHEFYQACLQVFKEERGRNSICVADDDAVPVVPTAGCGSSSSSSGPPGATSKLPALPATTQPPSPSYAAKAKAALMLPPPVPPKRKHAPAGKASPVKAAKVVGDAGLVTSAPLDYTGKQTPTGSILSTCRMAKAVETVGKTVAAPPSLLNAVSAVSKRRRLLPRDVDSRVPAATPPVLEKAMPARRTPVVLVEAAKVTAVDPAVVPAPAEDPWRAPEQPWDHNPHSEGGVMKVPASSTA